MGLVCYLVVREHHREMVPIRAVTHTCKGKLKFATISRSCHGTGLNKMNEGQRLSFAVTPLFVVVGVVLCDVACNCLKNTRNR